MELKYIIIIGRFQSLEWRGLLAGVCYWGCQLTAQEHSDSYMLGGGSRCYQMTAQECDLKGTLIGTQTGHMALFGGLFYIVVCISWCL